MLNFFKKQTEKLSFDLNYVHLTFDLKKIVEAHDMQKAEHITPIMNDTIQEIHEYLDDIGFRMALANMLGETIKTRIENEQ